MNNKFKNILIASCITLSIQPVVFAAKPVPQVSTQATGGLTAVQVNQLDKIIADRESVIAELITRFQPLAEGQGVYTADWQEKFQLLLEKLSDATLFRVSEAQTWTQLQVALDAGKVIKFNGTQQLGNLDGELVYTPLTPCRLLDTRNATRWGFHAPIPGGTKIDAWAYGFRTDQGGAEVSSCGVDPSSKGIAINVTLVPVVGTGLGYLTVWPWSFVQPLASSLNWNNTNSTPIGNELHQAICRGCSNEISIYAFKTAHVVVDVVGYYAAPRETLPEQYVTTSTYDSIPAFSIYDQWSPACPTGYALSGGGANHDFYTVDVRTVTSRPQSGTGSSIISGNNVADRWQCQYYNNEATSQPVWCQSVCLKVPGR